MLKYKLKLLQNKHLNLFGFTLIELLVVIAILGVIVVGLMVAIDPVDKINAAGDARVQSDFGAISRAAEAYATIQGYYPASLSDLTTSTTQELKVIPVPPSGVCGTTPAANIYDGGTNCDMTASSNVTPTGLQAACVLGTCKSIILYAPLKSKKYTSTPYIRYESATGKTCKPASAPATTAC